MEACLNMEQSTQKKLALFASNAQTIKKEFTWQNAMTKRLAALLYAQDSKPVDCESILSCHNLIKQNTGVFSTFRGHMVLCVASLLSLSPNPQSLIEESIKVYNLLKGVKMYASDFLVIAAFEIAKQTSPSDYPEAVNRTRAFYDGMKARHFFNTGRDDYIFAAMLGLTDLDVASGSERIEQLFNRLKNEFWDRNSVQALAQVLVLCGSDDITSNRALALRDALQAKKIRLDRSYTLPSLGILSMLPAEIDAIVREVEEARDYLRTQKGFGPLSVASQELLLHASALIAGKYAQEGKAGVTTATLSTGITNLIIAQQAAMIAAISSTSAAAASSSSSK